MAFCYGNYTPCLGWCGTGCGSCNFNCAFGGCGCNRRNGSNYGSFYATGTVSLSGGSNVPLTGTITANGVTINPTTGIVTLPATGSYRVSWGTLATTTETTATTALYLTGTEVTGTRRTISSGNMTGGSAIIAASAGDTLTIRLTATEPVSLTDTNGGIIAYLTVEQIA